MPIIVVNRRAELGLKFREVFDKFTNKNAVEILQKRYFPTHSFPNSIMPPNSNSNIRGPCTLYQILYLKVYISLKNRGFNLGKTSLREDELVEYNQIIKTLENHPWLDGRFQRY